MPKETFNGSLRRFLYSKKGLAIPLTYLILFSSLIVIISLTYSFAVTKIGAESSILKVSIAKQNMLNLDNAIRSVAWSSEASKVVYMDDCGGLFETKPTAKNLLINFTDEQTFYTVVFNSSVGKIHYKLEPFNDNYVGLFLKGDSKSIVNKTSSTITQLHFEAGNDSQELTLSYRPLATTALIGEEDGKPLNLIRIYIINLNSSPNLTFRENFYLKVTSVNVTVATYSYNFSQQVSSLALKASFNGEALSTVWLKISSNTNGAYVKIEVVTCNIKVQRVVL